MKKLLSIVAALILSACMWAVGAPLTGNKIIAEDTAPEMTLEELWTGDYDGNAITHGTISFMVDATGFFIQDGNYGVEVSLKEDYEGELNEGDQITISGRFYHEGLLDESVIMEVVPGEKITPMVVELADLMANPATYNYLLIRLMDITITGFEEDYAVFDGVLPVMDLPDTYVEGDQLDITGMAVNGYESFFLITIPEWVSYHQETALDNATMDAKTHKTLRDGKLVIRVGERDYDAQGAAL